MKIIRCMVCRRTLPTVKTLRSHCMAAHSKVQLVRTILKNTIYPNNFQRKNKMSESKFENVKPQYLKTEILYLEDGFQNSLSENDSQFSNDEVAASFPKIEIKKEEESESDGNACSIENKDEIKDVIVKVEENERKRKTNLLKLRNFRFNRNKKHGVSLNDQNGLFYECHCSEEYINNNTIDCYQKNDLENLRSDTDSCSETGKNFYIPISDIKCYCDICGNGYSSKKRLIEHLEVHNTNCRICRKQFKDNFAYKQHMKKHLLKVFVCHLCTAEFGLKDMLVDHLDAHIEDDIYDNVFSLEQDYKIEKNNYINNFYLG